SGEFGAEARAYASVAAGGIRACEGRQARDCRRGKAEEGEKEGEKEGCREGCPQPGEEGRGQECAQGRQEGWQKSGEEGRETGGWTARVRQNGPEGAPEGGQEDEAGPARQVAGPVRQAAGGRAGCSAFSARSGLPRTRRRAGVARS